MNVKILGTGCKNCILLEKNVRKALSKLNIKTSVEVVEDIDKILDYNVMIVPALVINENVYSKGKALSESELIDLFQKIK